MISCVYVDTHCLRVYMNGWINLFYTSPNDYYPTMCMLVIRQHQIIVSDLLTRK